MANIISFQSRTGITVNFSVHPKHTAWPSAGGLYMFAQAPGGLRREWQALYVGQTNSLIERLPNHERWLEAYARGATHVGVCLVPDVRQREALERELIEFTQAPMNDLLKGATLADALRRRGPTGYWR